MTTRNDYQVSLDLLRFVNICNDLLNVAACKLQDVDPETGDPFLIWEGGEPRSATVGELKTLVQSDLQALATYRDRVQTFVVTWGQSNVNTALNNTFGVSGSAVMTELTGWQTVAQNVASNLGSATTKAQLATIGEYIDTNVPKLVLVRRPWILE